MLLLPRLTPPCSPLVFSLVGLLLGGVGCHLEEPAPVDLAPSACTYPTEGELLGTIAAPAIELSGLATSRRQPGHLWGHNDSGDGPRIFAFDEGGAIGAEVLLTDGSGQPVPAIDWEDLAASDGPGGPTLWVADTGDNAARETDGTTGRDAIAIYRLPEPDPLGGSGVAPVERLWFTYPDSPHDCEAVFVDPEDGALYLVTKQASPAPIYRAAPPFVDGQTRVLEQVGSVDLALVTAADASGDGRRIAVRGYVDVLIFARAPGQTIADAVLGAPVAAPAESTAEAIAFQLDGYGYYTAPEGKAPPLYRVGCE